MPDADWQIVADESDAGLADEAQTFDGLIDAIESTMERARNAAARHVCIDQLLAYWNNGRLIVEYEQNGRDRAEYGDKTLVRLSKRLTERLGRGFSRSNLQYMRLLYLKHPICQTLSGKLTFSHYCEVLDLDDDAKRGFYEREAANAGLERARTEAPDGQHALRAGAVCKGQCEQAGCPGARQRGHSVQSAIGCDKVAVCAGVPGTAGQAWAPLERDLRTRS